MGGNLHPSNIQRAFYDRDSVSRGRFIGFVSRRCGIALLTQFIQQLPAPRRVGFGQAPYKDRHQMSERSYLAIDFRWHHDRPLCI